MLTACDIWLVIKHFKFIFKAKEVMELGLDFDDTDFVEKVKEKQTLSSYNAKVCYPKWFLSEKADNGKNDPASLYKFKGDYHCYHKNFNSAIDCYKFSLEHLGSHNRTMRRELVDSLARCYIQEEKYDLAKQFVNLVFNECLTTDNWCQALLLQQQLLCSSGDYLEEVKVLHQLITIFRGNSEFWIKLSNAYRNIQKLNQLPHVDVNKKFTDKTSTNENGVEADCNDAILQNNELSANQKIHDENTIQLQSATNSCDEHLRTLQISAPDYNYVEGTSQHDCTFETKFLDVTSGYPLDLILLSCLLRARMVFYNVQATVEGFVKNRNLKVVEQLSKQIEELSVKESDLERATQYLKREVFEDESPDTEDKQLQGQDAKAIMENVVTCTEFNQKWFSWIKTD